MHGRCEAYSPRINIWCCNGVCGEDILLLSVKFHALRFNCPHFSDFNAILTQFFNDITGDQIYPICPAPHNNFGRYLG